MVTRTRLCGRNAGRDQAGAVRWMDGHGGQGSSGNELSTLHVRFYKAFNYDYLRRNDDRVTPKPWEMTGDLWYPHVNVDIEEGITTVVGSNESGKSQMLAAIKCALTGTGIERGDFCRYSNDRPQSRRCARGRLADQHRPVLERAARLLPTRAPRTVRPPWHRRPVAMTDYERPRTRATPN